MAVGSVEDGRVEALKPFSRTVVPPQGRLRVLRPTLACVVEADLVATSSSYQGPTRRVAREINVSAALHQGLGCETQSGRSTWWTDYRLLVRAVFSTGQPCPVIRDIDIRVAGCWRVVASVLQVSGLQPTHFLVVVAAIVLPGGMLDGHGCGSCVGCTS